MPQLEKIIRNLIAERAVVQATVAKLDRAIEALSGGKRRRLSPLALPKPPKLARHMSVAARKRIAAGQRARWARYRAQKAAKPPKPPVP